jgi:hypothetical protein
MGKGLSDYRSDTYDCFRIYLMETPSSIIFNNKHELRLVTLSRSKRKPDRGKRKPDPGKRKPDPLERDRASFSFLVPGS